MEIAGLDDVGALHHPPGRGQNEAHGEVGAVFGEHARRIGDDNAARMGGGHVDVVDADTEVGEELELVAGAGDDLGIDSVGDGRGQHVGAVHRRHQGLGVHGCVVEVEFGVEQLAHTRLHRIGELARDDDFRLASGHDESDKGSPGPATRKWRSLTERKLSAKQAGCVGCA